MPIACDIWHLPYMIEHMTASEQQNGDKANGSPKVTILNDRQDIGPCHAQKCDRTQKSSGHSDHTHPVDWSLDFRMGSVRQVTTDPRVDLLGGLWSERISARAAKILGCILTHWRSRI